MDHLNFFLPSGWFLLKGEFWPSCVGYICPTMRGFSFSFFKYCYVFCLQAEKYYYKHQPILLVEVSGKHVGIVVSRGFSYCGHIISLRDYWQVYIWTLKAIKIIYVTNVMLKHGQNIWRYLNIAVNLCFSVFGVLLRISHACFFMNTQTFLMFKDVKSWRTFKCLL